MKTEDVIINRVYETKDGEFCIGFKIKFGDISEDEKKKARDAWRDTILLTLNWDYYQQEEGSKTTLVGQGSIYQKFMLFCKTHGVDYEKQKQELGVAHLEDLEKLYPLEQIEAMLKERMLNLEYKLGII